jgi:hypothetical protein
MKGLKGPLDRNIQEIRGMTQQEDLLEIDTFVTASGTLDRLPDRPEQARHISFGRHVTAQKRTPRDDRGEDQGRDRRFERVRAPQSSEATRKELTLA